MRALGDALRWMTLAYMLRKQGFKGRIVHDWQDPCQPSPVPD